MEYAFFQTVYIFEKSFFYFLLARDYNDIYTNKEFFLFQMMKRVVIMSTNTLTLFPPTLPMYNLFNINLFFLQNINK